MSEPIDLNEISEPFNAEKFLGLDRQTVVSDSTATEGNSWEEAATETVWRYSYKYKITRADGSKPMLDYVFASSYEDARVKAYEKLEIPEGEDITISRISETTNKTWSLS